MRLVLQRARAGELSGPARDPQDAEAAAHPVARETYDASAHQATQLLVVVRIRDEPLEEPHDSGPRAAAGRLPDITTQPHGPVIPRPSAIGKSESSRRTKEFRDVVIVRTWIGHECQVPLGIGECRACATCTGGRRPGHGGGAWGGGAA